MVQLLEKLNRLKVDAAGGWFAAGLQVISPGRASRLQASPGNIFCACCNRIGPTGE
jgi:hypothetical protein